MAAFAKKSGYDIVSNRRDQRQETRKSIGMAASIRLGGFASRSCTVLDLSDAGVRISVERAASVPDEFTLLLSKAAHGRRARVKWRRGNHIGAKFL